MGPVGGEPALIFSASRGNITSLLWVSVPPPIKCWDWTSSKGSLASLPSGVGNKEMVEEGFTEKGWLYLLHLLTFPRMPSVLVTFQRQAWRMKG